MKGKILFTAVVIILGVQLSNAQWSLTGNAPTAAQFLGTTNNTNLRIRTNNTEKMVVLSSGNVGIGNTAPTAVLHLKAGTATAGTAPFKFTSGVNLTTAEAGAMEYNGSALFITVGSPAVARKEIAFADLSNITGTVGVIRGGTGLTTVAAGDILYGSAANVISRLAAGTNGHVLTLQGGVPVWAAASGGGGAITTLNTLTAATQTFATGTGGTDFGISSSGSIHTFNLPTASAGARGLLSPADWTTFNSKAPATGGAGYIQNGTSVQASSNFNISGNGTIGNNLVVKGTSIELGSASQSGQVVMYLKQQSNPSGNGWNFGYTSFNSSDLYLYGHESAAFKVYTSTLERFTVGANGNIGINNNNPQAKLDVAGTFKLVDGTQGANKVLTSDASGNASWQTVSGGGGQWTTSGNNIYNNNTGNVGIGNSNPASKLDVSGNLTLAKDAGNYTANSISMLNPVNAVNAKLNSGSSGLELFTTTGHPVIFGVNNTSAAALFTNGNFRISSTNPEFNDNGNRLQVDGSAWVGGNLGIGTVSPGAKLDVAGNIRSTGYAQFVNPAFGIPNVKLGYDGTNPEAIQISGASISAPAIKIQDMSYAIDNGKAVIDITADHSYMYGSSNNGSGAALKYTVSTYNPAALNHFGTFINMQDNAAGSAASILGNYTKLQTVNGNSYGYYVESGIKAGGTGTAYAFYAQSGKNYFADNVGIGNTNPQAKLDVAGTFKLVDGTQGANKVLTSDANGNASWQTPSGGGGGQWTTSGNNIYNNNTGNVGIGNNNPANKLDVSGTTKLQGNSDAVQLTVQANATQNTDLVRVVTSAGNNAFRVTKDGLPVWASVGYDAVTTPAASFQPTVAYDGTNVIWGNSSANQQIAIGAIGNGYTAKPNIQFNGYGTIVNTTFGGTFYVVNPPGGFGNASALVMAVKATNGQTANLMEWQNDGGTALSVVKSDGSVTIGTTNLPAGYKLAVGGNIIAEKVRVKLQSTGWPDYVFATEYPLPSLKETEQFIKQNNHLPGVPSAAEVEKQGLDLGDGQAVLLKKIEELTLHLIEMDKKIEKLITENESLKRKVNR